MAYTAVPDTDVLQWDTQYQVLSDSLPNQINDLQRAAVTSQMQSLGAQAEERLNRDIRTISGYFQQHSQKVDRWLVEAQQVLKDAKKAAADYKSAPGKLEYAAVVNGAPRRIELIQNAFDQDALEFGQAWFGYRTLDPHNLPAKYFASFREGRSKTMNAQKATALKHNKIVAAHQEAKALLDIVAKAKLKSRGNERTELAYETAARQAATQLEALLADLKNPDGATPKPTSIAGQSSALVNWTTDVTFNTRQQLITARGTWANVQGAYKAMVTKAASMEKVLATKTKGFRKSELTNATVTAEMRKAAKAIADAKAEIKKHDKNYANAKKAMDKIEANFKKRGIR